MKPLLPAVLALLAVMSIAATAQAAHATTGPVTLHSLTVTTTINGQTFTTTLKVVDTNSDGVISLAVGSGLLSRIQGAFGTTTFAFPGSFTGTFTVNGSKVTVTLSSTDTFTLIFTQAPPGVQP